MRAGRREPGQRLSPRLQSPSTKCTGNTISLVAFPFDTMISPAQMPCSRYACKAVPSVFILSAMRGVRCARNLVLLRGCFVRSFRRCLELAGIRGSVLRSDYSAAGRFLRRREPVNWGAVRVLTPAEFQPRVVAGTALVCITDDLCDSGPRGERKRRFEAWAERVRDALDSGVSDHPLLRAYLHAADVQGLSRGWIDSYLAGIRTDLEFAGFAAEEDHQRYIDRVTWPALMVISGLLPHLVSDERFAASCRLIADGSQRADFLIDLAEDLRDGRLALPLSDLDRYGVSRADLEHGRDTPGVRALISATADTARTALIAGGRIVEEVSADHRPAIRCLTGLYQHRLDSVSALGSAVTQRPPRDDPWECLRLLARSRRADPPDRGSGWPEPPNRAP